MAAAHIPFDRNSDVGRNIVRALQMIRDGRELLINTRLVMLGMRDGDGSDPSHYDMLASKGGYQAGDYADANSAARASFEELSSLWSKLTTDASVVEVATAISQGCSKHGI